MADRRAPKTARQRKAPPPRGLTTEEFRATSAFAHFKAVMRRVMAVPKAELDKMVRETKRKRGNKVSHHRKPR